MGGSIVPGWRQGHAPGSVVLLLPRIRDQDDLRKSLDMDPARIRHYTYLPQVR